MKLHNVVATLRRISGIVEERKTTRLDRWGWARGQHELDRIVGGPPIKTSLADLRDFTQGHIGHFHTQVNDQLTHIWRKVPRCLLWLFPRLGSEEADHA